MPVLYMVSNGRVFAVAQMGFPTASRDWHPFQRSPPFIQSKAPKTGPTGQSQET